MNENGEAPVDVRLYSARATTAGVVITLRMPKGNLVEFRLPAEDYIALSVMGQVGDSNPDYFRNTVSLASVVNRLNEALALDPEYFKRLLGQRLPCNQALADHATVEAGPVEGGGFDLGFMGLLNGLVRSGPGARFSLAWLVSIATAKVEGFSVVDHHLNSKVYPRQSQDDVQA